METNKQVTQYYLQCDLISVLKKAIYRDLCLSASISRFEIEYKKEASAILSIIP